MIESLSMIWFVLFYSIYHHMGIGYSFNIMIFRYTTSAVVLQEESGLFTGDNTNRYPIIQKITKDVIAGEWDAVESALREYCRPEFSWHLLLLFLAV